MPRDGQRTANFAGNGLYQELQLDFAFNVSLHRQRWIRRRYEVTETELLCLQKLRNRVHCCRANRSTVPIQKRSKSWIVPVPHIPLDGCFEPHLPSLLLRGGRKVLHCR